MKWTTLIYSTLLLSLSTTISGTSVVDNTDAPSTEKLYVNPQGEVVIPQEFPWGRYVMKEKDAARNRTTCAGRMDPSGRLGKRQAYCPSGYTLACDAYAASPCCPNETPVCCSAGTVCCAAGQFCQGTSTCCNAGQIGCGEGCCNFGETCCGNRCCGAGMTCDNGTCNTPPGYVTPTYSYEPPTSTSSTPVPNVPPTYGPGASRTITPTYSNPYGSSITISIPSYTIPIRADVTSPPESTCSGGGGGGDSSSSNSSGNIGVNNNTATIVGSVLGAFSTFISGLAAWFYKKKNDAEKALADVLKPSTPPPVEEEKPKPEPPKEERPAYVGNENSYVERPITGSPAIAGHGNNYT